MNFDVLSSWSGDLTTRNMVTQGQYDASAQLQTLCDRPVSLMMASASAEPGKSVKGLDPGYSAIIELNAENLRNVPSFCEQGQVSRAVTMTGASSDPLVGPVPGLERRRGAVSSVRQRQQHDGARLGEPQRPARRHRRVPTRLRRQCTQQPGHSRGQRASAEVVLMTSSPSTMQLSCADLRSQSGTHSTAGEQLS